MARYVGAVGLLLLAFSVRFSVEKWMEGRAAYLPFLAAVAVVAVWFGRGPAILALLGGIFLGQLFLEPRFAALPKTPADILYAIAYLAFGAMIIALVQLLHRAHAEAEARAASERRLRESQEQLRLVFEQVKDYAIITMDLHGTILNWSPGAEALFGFTQDEVLQKSAHILATPEDRKQRTLETQMALAAREGKAASDHWLVRKNGSRFWGTGLLFALRDGSGTVTQFAKVVRDGTEFRHAQETLQRDALAARSALAEAAGQMDAFTYTVAHDLRAPLRALQGFSQILLTELSDCLGSDVREYLERIAASAARMNALVSDLLEFGNLGREKPELYELSLDAIAGRAAASFAKPIGDVGGRIEVSGPFPRGWANEELLRMILSELISNALKFRAPQQPLHVRIHASHSDGFVRLGVTDNGLGIAQEHHEKIFRVFERLEPSTPHDGTGIGLAIVRKATELMNGRVGVESKPGQGSTFWIELPAAPFQSVTQRAAASVPAQ